MIKIYGSPRSSAGRCYLLLEELGLKYETVPLDMSKKEHKSESFLKLNPNGKVPCLIDGSFTIWESLAINYYLTDKYKPELLGSNPEERGIVQQWSTWALSELQPPMVDIIIQMVFTPEEKRDMNQVGKAREKIPPHFKILDHALSGKKYLLGDKLSLADFNTASVVNIAAALQIPTDVYPNLTSWMSNLRERPAFRKFSDLRN